MADICVKTSVLVVGGIVLSSGSVVLKIQVLWYVTLCEPAHG